MKDGVGVAVRVAPRAAREGIGEVVRDADGGAVLKVAVGAAPEGGKANDAVIRLLAKAWRLPRTSLTVAAGATGRRKTIHAAGDPDDLFRRLTDWMEDHHG